MTKSSSSTRSRRRAASARRTPAAPSTPSSRSIEEALRSGEDVNFTGFGKFHVAERGAREGRNPRTGEPIQIAASKVPRFTAGSGLKKAVK